MSVTIYHNPRCTKSRQTLALLESKGIEPKVVKYLDQPFSLAGLKGILKKLGQPASGIVRSKEARFKELGLVGASEAQLLSAMVENPVLVERPIVVNGDKAAIGRPPEAVLAIL